jgi:four helix bundle protein
VETLKVYQKWEDMMAYLYIALRSYPKSERFTLAARTAECGVDIGTSIVRGNTVGHPAEKRRNIEHADVELARLKILIRLGMKLEFLPLKKYGLVSTMLVEIGKMIGGWLRSSSGHGGMAEK